MKTQINAEVLAAEKTLIDKTLDAIEVLSSGLAQGLPNREKNEARTKLREAFHWLSDGSTILAAFTKEFEAKVEKAEASSLGLVGPDGLPVKRDPTLVLPVDMAAAVKQLD